MTREEIIERFCQMGNWIEQGLESGEFDAVIRSAFAKNTWFCEEFVKQALKGIALWLRKDEMESFVADYGFAKEPKKVAIIAAGNIPAVGFHDIMCVLLSGNTAVCKLSYKDEVILPFLFKKYFPEEVIFTSETLKGFDAVIATGSNNSALHFENYFGKYPHIIRHGRNSIAVLSGKESEEQLQALADDILLYAGLGCRSVSRLFVPKDYDFSLLKSVCERYAWLRDLNKYRNNLDYHRAIFIMNNLAFVDLDNLLMIENGELASGVSVVNYTYYENESEVAEYIEKNRENIQIVIGDNPSLCSIALGDGQNPQIKDFADGVDTMRWLSEL